MKVAVAGSLGEVVQAITDSKNHTFDVRGVAFVSIYAGAHTGLMVSTSVLVWISVLIRAVQHVLVWFSKPEPGADPTTGRITE
jgi:hypothetical protein